MRNALRAVVLAVPLLFVSACGQSDEAKDDMEVKQTYSLCPISKDSRQRLYDQVKSFADHHVARFIDRSAEEKQEISDIGSEVLIKTGGSTNILTVEKQQGLWDT